MAETRTASSHLGYVCVMRPLAFSPPAEIPLRYTALLLIIGLHAQQARNGVGKAERESALCSSYPPSIGLPRQQQQQQHAEILTANKADRRLSSGSTNTATSTGRPSIDSSEERSTGGESASLTEAATALDATGTNRTQNAWGWGNDVRRWRARGGAVKAIVSADYSGEIKIFLGFVGDS